MEQVQNAYRIYRRITDQIAAAIAAGAPKFEMPWHRPALVMPFNAATTKPYQGVNVLSLWIAAQIRSFGTGYWATYRQWAGLGAQVRKGEKGSPIVFYKKVEHAAAEEDAGDEMPEKRLVARASFVFNADQVDNWRPPELARPHSPVLVIEHAEQFVLGVGAEIHESDGKACYMPHADYILIPRRELFTGTSTSSPTEAYYATLFHELVHWTGHESRLNRDLAKRFGDEAYAMEELVAELGAAFLCADNQVNNAPRADHAAYVASWLRVLGNDPRAITIAAGKASTAARFLNDRSSDTRNRLQSED